MIRRSQRIAYGEALVELGRQNESIVVLDADLSCSTQSAFFAKEFPDRFFNVGIAEANMISMAGGFAAGDMIPFASTFSVFITLRGGDQVRQSIAYPALNVKLCGTNAGLSNPADGATHQDISDLAIMRVMPNMTVIAPCDYLETKKAVRAAAEYYGPVYMRVCRESVPDITDNNTEFKLGKANMVQDGCDLTLISTGTIISEVIDASERLRKENISVRILNMHTIKPIDKEAIITATKETGAIVSIEEHSVYGGLGGAIAEIIAMNNPVPLEIVGIRDSFGESSRDYSNLLKKYGLSKENIYKAALKALDRKRRAVLLK